MDYFQLRNIQSVKFASAFQITDQLRFFADAYLFTVLKPQSDDWIAANGGLIQEAGEGFESGGVELDIGLSYVIDKSFSLDIGHGFFSKEPQVQGTGEGDGFTYIQFSSSL